MDDAIMMTGIATGVVTILHVSAVAVAPGTAVGDNDSASILTVSLRYRLFCPHLRYLRTIAGLCSLVSYVDFVSANDQVMSHENHDAFAARHNATTTKRLAFCFLLQKKTFKFKLVL
jgi:nucleoside phosphorylase